MRRRRLWPLLACLVAVSASAAAAEPVIPLQTYFSHWDHHWLAWIPDHPMYESIEVAVSARAARPALVWVWLTERAESKRQVHYFNDSALARLRGPAAHHREISYRVSGDAGGPLDLELRFKDLDDRDVELRVDVDPPRRFEPRSAGLTDQSGHAADRFFLVFFREKSAPASRVRLTIDGRSYAVDGDAAVREHRFRAASSANVFVAVIPFGPSRFARDLTTLTMPTGVPLRRHTLRSGVTLLRNEGTGREVVSAEFDTREQLRWYEHAVGEHRFRITFDPALPASGGSARYTMSLDDFGPLIHGIARVTGTADEWSIEWRHERPSWTSGYYFTSIVRALSPSGYELTIAPTPR